MCSPAPFGGAQALCTLLVVVVTSVAAAIAQSGQLPTLKSGVELIAVDVEVVAGNGEPIAGLQPSDFDVRIDGKVRRVVSADFVRYNVATSVAHDGRCARGASPASAPAVSHRR